MIENEAMIRSGDRQALRDLSEQRLRDRQALFLQRHGVSWEAFEILRSLHARPGLAGEISDAYRRLDIGEVVDEFMAIISDENANHRSVCRRCNAIFPTLSTRTNLPAAMVMTRWMGVCDRCIDSEMSKESTPRDGAIRTSIYRARRARLPSTLTDEQWIATVAHFENRCAYCGGPWHVVEHLVPIELGGGTTKGNCVPSCTFCNGTKGRKSVMKLDRRYYPLGRIDRILAFMTMPEVEDV